MGSNIRNIAIASATNPASSCHKTCGAAPLENRGNFLPEAEWFALMGRDIWKFKVANVLHHVTGRSDRTCRAWSSGDSEPPGRVLALLLRSDEGAAVLAWIMRGSDARWWRELCLASAAVAILAEITKRE